MTGAGMPGSGPGFPEQGKSAGGGLMIRAVLAGAGGAVGKEIVKRIAVTEGIKLAGAIERQGHPLAGRDIGDAAGIGPMHIFITETTSGFGDADVVLCFTPGGALVDYLRLASANNVSIVIGTCGLSSGELDLIRMHSEKTRCVLVPCLGPTDFSISQAIRAAKWVVGRSNGLYDMQDII